MTITAKNYFKEYAKLDSNKLPEALAKSHGLVMKASKDGNDWSEYESNENIKRVIDLYFSKLSEFVKSSSPTKKQPKRNTGPAKPTSNSQNKKKRTVARKTSSSSNSTQVNKLKVQLDPKADKVEMISDELKFIRRFVNMHDKPKTRNQIRLFVNALQRSIRERRIRKTSPFAKEVLLIQDELIKLHTQFDNDTEQIAPDISEKTRVRLFKILGKEIELTSVKLIKSYIGLQGRIVENVKAARLLKRIESAITKKNITKRDPYWGEVNQIIANLKSFVKKNPNHGVLQIEQRSLNGLQGIVDCNCSSSEIISGLPEKLDVEKLTEDYFSNKKQGDDRFLMNSKAYSNINFYTYGLKGKWLQLFGDPEVGFSAVIMGSPKMGKSTLAIEFSGDMAKGFGDVLYVAREEGKSETFKRKLKEATAAHNNLYVSNYIPVNVGDFRFVIIDSVTKMGLSSRNLEALDKTYKETSFLGVHQVTKDGKARGTNEFIHDADVIVNVIRPGFAVSRGRFNEGGELDFFNEAA